MLWRQVWISEFQGIYYDQLSYFLFCYHVRKFFDECDDQSNKNLAMITTIIYVNHKTELEDYVKNIALICFYCKYFLLKKIV